MDISTNPHMINNNSIVSVDNIWPLDMNPSSYFAHIRPSNGLVFVVYLTRQFSM
jgi:hypothetical protein